MFRIECFCDDKKLPGLLRALASLGAMSVTSVPVVNATAANGRVKETDSDLPPMPTTILEATKKGQVFAPADAAEWLTRAGFSRVSTSSALATLVKARRLKRRGKSSKTTYEVL